MDHRQMLLCLFWVTRERENIVLIAHSGKIIISLPAVSADDGTRRHIFRDESGKRLNVAAGERSNYLFHAGDDAEPKAPGVSAFLDWGTPIMTVPPLCAADVGVLTRPHLYSANYRRLMMSAFSFAPCAAAYKAFVDLDGMRRADCISVWSNHPGAKLVKHRECRFIGSDVKLALKLESGLAGCLCCHEVGAPKPYRERHMARLHDRSGSKGRIFLTGPATQHNRRACCETVRLAGMPACLARKSVRPTHRLQVAGASGIVRKDALEFRKARWKGCVHV
jgi:hypothetical protein